MADAAEMLGLTALLERYPRQLSGGQRQRVAMGRAIVRRPKVFLFDGVWLGGCAPRASDTGLFVDR